MWSICLFEDFSMVFLQRTASTITQYGIDIDSISFIYLFIWKHSFGYFSLHRFQSTGTGYEPIWFFWLEFFFSQFRFQRKQTEILSRSSSIFNRCIFSIFSPLYFTIQCSQSKHSQPEWKKVKKTTQQLIEHIEVVKVNDKNNNKNKKKTWNDVSTKVCDLTYFSFRFKKNEIDDQLRLVCLNICLRIFYIRLKRNDNKKKKEKKSDFLIHVYSCPFYRPINKIWL